ncbi:MAG: hypothetical protein ACRD2E_13895, partial [Terriglobales bacterium]
LSPRGTPMFPLAGSPEESGGCAAWVRVNPVQFVLPPGTTETVRYTIQVPPGTPAEGCNASILFTSAPLRRTGTANQIFTRVRMASILYVTVGHPTVAGRLADISLAPPAASGQPWQMQLRIANTGPTFFRASGTAALVNASGQAVASFDLGSQVVLAQTSRVLRFALKTPPAPGQYQLRARVEMGLPAIQQIEKEVAIGGAVPVAPGAKAAPAQPVPHGASQ